MATGHLITRVCERSLRHPKVTAFLAGASSVAAFAPFDLPLLAPLMLALLFRLWLNRTPVDAFTIGWSFGIGFLGFGVSWLHVSIDQFGNVGTPLALFATLLFVLFVAIFFALAGALGRMAGGSPAVQLLLAFPAAWCLLEWLRGWVLTGFPWLALGYSQIDSPLAGYAPIAGVYGVSAVLASAAGVLALWSIRTRIWPIWSTALLLLVLGGYLLQQLSWTRPDGEPIKVAMIQANIPQHRKWDPELRLPTLRKYAGHTRKHADRDLVVWPETAIPDFLHRVQESFLGPFAMELAENNTALIAGIPVLDLDTGRYYNAAVVAGDGDPRADPATHYYKRHLVPFGEYMPFKTWLGPLLSFMEIPMSDFADGNEARPLLRVGERLAGISICYEDAFGAEVREALPEATYLINLSNDAWFGDSLAPHQHLQIARMRALENARPLIRSTNTGISALIDPKGRLLATTGAFEETVLSGEVTPMTGETPFVRFGNVPAVALMSVALALAFLIGIFRSRFNA